MFSYLLFPPPHEKPSDFLSQHFSAMCSNRVCSYHSTGKIGTNRHSSSVLEVATAEAAANMSLLPRDWKRMASTTTGAASSHEVSMVDDEVF